MKHSALLHALCVASSFARVPFFAGVYFLPTENVIPRVQQAALFCPSAKIHGATVQLYSLCPRVDEHNTELQWSLGKQHGGEMDGIVAITPQGNKLCPKGFNCSVSITVSVTGTAPDIVLLSRISRLCVPIRIQFPFICLLCTTIRSLAVAAIA